MGSFYAQKEWPQRTIHRLNLLDLGLLVSDSMGFDLCLLDLAFFTLGFSGSGS